MISNFDFNKRYKTLGEKVLAAKSALRATTFGLGGAIRVEEDPSNLGNIRFVLNATGETFKSMDQALNRASSMFISQTIRVTSPEMGNKLAGLGSVMDDIRKNVSKLDQNSKKLLKDAGIDISKIPSMEVDVVTLGGGSPQQMAQKVLKMRETGQLHGIASVDDKGGRVLTMRLGATGNTSGQMLTAEQINLLLRVTGHGLIREEEIAAALTEGNSGKLADKLLKFGKRFRTFVSERELSFAGATLTDLIGKRAMTDAFLVLDPQYEMMMMFAKQTLGENYDFGGNAGLKAYYKGRNVDSYFGQYLESLSDAQRKKLAKAIVKHGDGIKVGRGEFASNILEDLIKDEFKGSKKILKAFQESYASIEYAFDGSDLLNSKYLTSYRNSMQTEIGELKKQVNNINLPKNQREAAANQLKKLENIVRQIGENGSIDFEQIIGRGNLPGYGNIKTAFDSTSDIFNIRGLRDYVGIISKFGLKKEMGLAGEEGSLLLAGFGRYRDLVYSDPVSTAFHPEVFADKATLESIEKRAQTVLTEFQAAIDQGTIPKKLKTLLQKQAEATVEHLPSEARATAARNREFAKSILEMLNSGVSPKESPRMMNMLHKIYATQIFRTEIGKDGSNVYKTVLPETYRFALDTEKSLRGEDAVLGRGFEQFKAQGMQDAQDILTFRAKGHKIYFAPQAVGQVRGSLGGFDLDDKGIAKMFRYTDDNGMTRIAFNLTRQPPGAEEKMLARAYLDEDTIRSLFKESTYFREALDELILGKFLPGSKPHVSTISAAFIDPTKGPDISASKEYQTLMKLEQILEGKSIEHVYSEFDPTTGKLITRVGKGGETTRIRAELESAIETVYRQMEDMGFTAVRDLTSEQIKEIQKSGTASLRVQQLLDGGESVKPRYSRAGIYNVFGDQGAFDMSKELREVIQQASYIDQAKKTELLAATSFEDMLTKIRGDQSAMAALSSAFQHKALTSMAKGGDILGTYVNRSMVVGSTLNQYEAFLNESTKDVRDFLLKNFQIGMLYQEEAIDYSVNATGTSRVVDFGKQRAFHMESTRILADIQSGQVDYFNLEGIERSMRQLIGEGASAELGLNAIGERSVKSLGQLIGAQRAIASGMTSLGEDLMLGIDEILIKERLSSNDTRILIENIIEGMKQAYGFDSTLENLDVNKNIMNQLNTVLEEASRKPDRVKEIVLENFALRADHTYASLSRHQAIGARFEGYMEAVRRTTISNINDDILKAAETTAQSDVFAQEFLARNRQLITSINNQFADELDNMSSAQMANHRANIDYISRQLLEQIDQGSKIQGMSMEALVNSIDKAARSAEAVERGTGIDIGRLMQLREAFEIDTGGLETVEERIAMARRLRKAKFFQSFDQDFARSAITQLGVAKESELAEAAEKMIKSSTQSDDLLQATYQVLAGSTKDIVDENLLREAQTQAAIIRESMFLDENVDQIDELMRTGTISTAEELIQEFGDDPSISEDVLNSIINYENYESVNKAKFKTFSQKIKDGDFKTLFKDPLIKRSTLALGALVAGSFVYTAIRDRTSDDMSGPPLLPGGSAYEQQYPTRIPEIGSFSGQGYTAGDSYNVSINGSPDDIQRFNEAARGLVNGNSSTTIFNRIPDVRTDLYSMFASSY